MLFVLHFRISLKKEQQEMNILISSWLQVINNSRRLYSMKLNKVTNKIDYRIIILNVQNTIFAY
jgi:hypothetical protein